MVPRMFSQSFSQTLGISILVLLDAAPSPHIFQQCTSCNKHIGLFGIQCSFSIRFPIRTFLKLATFRSVCICCQASFPLCQRQVLLGRRVYTTTV